MSAQLFREHMLEGDNQDFAELRKKPIDFVDWQLMTEHRLVKQRIKSQNSSLTELAANFLAWKELISEALE